MAKAKLYRSTGSVYRVVPREGGWKIISAGSERAVKSAPTKARALQLATDLARRHQGEIVIHNKSGRIVSRDSYRMPERHVHLINTIARGLSKSAK